MYCNFFIHSSVNGHRGWLYIVLQWTLGCICLFRPWLPLGICLGVGLLGHMVVLFLAFKGISIPSSIVAASIYISTNSERAFPFLHSLSSIYYLYSFDEGHSDPCEVITHWGFDLHFSNREWCWVSFHVFVSHLHVFSGEMSVSVFFPLFDWVVCFSSF